MLTFIIRRLLWSVLVMFVYHGGRVHPLLQDARRRPGPRPRGPQPEPADPGGDPGTARARPAIPDRVRHHDEEDLHHPGPVCPTPTRACGWSRRSSPPLPRPLSLVFGAAVLWVGDGDSGRGSPLRCCGARSSIRFLWSSPWSASPHRSSGWARSPTCSHRGTLHSTFLFSWVPAARVYALHPEPGTVVQGLVIPWITLSLLYIGFYGACCAPIFLRCRTRTTSGPPARRESPSGGCCSGTRCGHR